MRLKHNHSKYLAILALALALPLRSACAQASPSPGPSKYALLIGINNYEYPNAVSPLAGSVNDVEDMRQVLIGKFNFPPENILVLTNAQATHAAIINAIKTQLIAKAHPGDIVVFHYSGHGSQMKDVTGTMASGLDETIVPYDSRDPQGKVFDISGAELHPLLVQLAGKTPNVTFILDSCHSGTLVRGARVRSISPDTREVSPAAAASINAARNVGPADNGASPKFAFIAAATSRESAFEHVAGDKDHGALTYFLAQQLRSARAGATYRDIMDNVIGNVAAAYPNQHVSLEGVEQDQYVFGDGSSLAHNYVVASPSMDDPRQVTLGVGQVENATVGSTYDVYPPGSRKFALPEKPLGRVRITAVSALTADTVFVGSPLKIPAASRAVEREHRYGAAKLRVYLDGPQDSQSLQALRDALQPLKYIEVVSQPTLCNMQVRETGGTLQTLGADSSTRSAPVPLSDPNAVSRVVEQLRQWAKWFSVLSIRNAQSDISLAFALKGRQTRDPMARVGRPDVGVTEGEIIDATLTNNYERDLYVAILDLSSDGSVAVVYPAQEGSQAVLKPGTSLTRSLKPSVPKGRSSVTDVLKVFASFKPIDLGPLTQGQIRGLDDNQGTDDPLQQLLNDASGTTRSVEVVSNGPTDLGSWTTAQRVLVIRRAQ
jgi:Caspase domain